MKPIEELPVEFMSERRAPDSGDGTYQIPHQKIEKYYYFIIFTSGMGWEHMSVTLRQVISRGKHKGVDRCPTWEDMCFLKDMFWGPDECCVQYHPPMQDNISNHNYCLHIWRPSDGVLPAPPSVMVGLKDAEALLGWMKEKYPDLEYHDYMLLIYMAEGDKAKIDDPESMKAFEERIAALNEPIQ